MKILSYIKNNCRTTSFLNLVILLFEMLLATYSLTHKTLSNIRLLVAIHESHQIYV